jgi:hypothetical protein
MGGQFPVWPLFLFGGLLTFIALCIFVGIYLSAREEGRKTRDGK